MPKPPVTSVPKAEIEAKVGRVAQYLDLLIFESGIGVRNLENRLGVSHGTVARLLSGRVELKLRHIFEFLSVLEIPDEVFFKGLAVAKSDSPRAAEMRRRHQATPLPAPASSPGVTRDEVFELIRNYFEGILGERAQATQPTEDAPPPVEEAPPPQAPPRRRTRRPRRAKKSP